jgi:hypothetical protein
VGQPSPDEAPILGVCFETDLRHGVLSDFGCAYEAVAGAGDIALLTEWNESRALACHDDRWVRTWGRLAPGDLLRYVARGA